MTQGHKRVTVNASRCEFDYLSRKLNISYFISLVLVTRLSATLSSATQPAMLPEYGGKWGTKQFLLQMQCLKNCLDTSLPFNLDILKCAKVKKYTKNRIH